MYHRSVRSRVGSETRAYLSGSLACHHPRGGVGCEHNRWASVEIFAVGGGGEGLTAVYTLFIGSIGRASFKLASQKLEGQGCRLCIIT